MLITRGNGYIIERNELINNGKGSNPVVTRVVSEDGLFTVEFIGPRILPSKIRVNCKKPRIEKTTWDRINYFLNFDFRKIKHLSIEEKKIFIKNEMKKEGFNI